MKDSFANDKRLTLIQQQSHQRPLLSRSLGGPPSARTDTPGLPLQLPGPTGSWTVPEAFHSPSCVFQHLGTSGSFFGFLVGSTTYWTAPSGLQGPCLPSFKTEETGWNQQQRTNGLMDGGVYRSEASFWRDTPLCAVDSGQDMVAGFAPELDF